MTTTEQPPETGPITETGRGWVARLLLKAVGLYRLTAPARVPRCRYIPTCSAYAEEAVERYGAGRGSWLALRRVLRCHPFGSFGFDPVPDLDPPADSINESAPSAQSRTGES